MKYEVIEINTHILVDRFVEAKETVAIFDNKQSAENYVNFCNIELQKCSFEYEKAKEYWSGYIQARDEYKKSLNLDEYKTLVALRKFNVDWFKTNNIPNNIKKFFDWDYLIKLIKYFSDKRNLALHEYFKYVIKEKINDDCYITDDPIFKFFEQNYIPINYV